MEWTRTKRIIFGVFVVFLLLPVFAAVRSCNRPNPAPQAEQTVASGDALANAAQDAVSTVTNRTEAERAIAAATAELKEEIGNAATPVDLRSVVAGNVCLRPEYRNDPACALR